ncbi:multidrug effflux MFS transporter [Candidatus Kirkpatrickella diaphorinae]|uniref:Bcr/CflA family efflux transporter n=1 Tax=Candidatus Kirkpatrickella diaphorinae TaxID=2984322 RepID=A0ABY6GJX9_9PROT|nr:multidrug effflux MFS transporter [Candidatus Kirkpatrickella diaphorinae]UYH50971.1 multidrug effflux MFS transporter [Candidatus Kirkpatrickella diaphorinae]
MLLTGARNAAGARLSSIRRGQQLEDIAHRHRIYERVAFLLGMICAVGPISTDIYLPAFPAIEQSLHAPSGSAGLTLSTWMVGLAMGQIIMGPLSDRFGRRAVMFWGMVAYTLSSVACAWATTMTLLAIARFFAALAASSCIVVPSAAVRDFATGDAASRLMSRLILIQGTVPVLAPMLGGFALEWVSWRAVFWLSAGYGVLSSVILIFLFPETLPLERRKNVHILALWQRFHAIIREPLFSCSSLIYGLSGFMFFAYLTAAPGIFQHLYRFSPAHYGMIFGICAVCMIGASQINSVLVGKVRSTRLLGWALSVTICSTLLLLIVAMIAVRYPEKAGTLRATTLPPFITLLITALSMTGIIAPNIIVQALKNHHQHAGSASALAGTIQYVFGAAASFLIGSLPAASPLPMVALMFIAAILMGLVAARKPRSLSTPDILSVD